MNLLELQRRMSQDVMRPLTPDFAMQATTEDGSPYDEFAANYIKQDCKQPSTAVRPRLVPIESFGNAVALSSSSFQVATIAGPTLGGLLYLAGPQTVYGVVATLLAIACVLMSLAKVRQANVAASSQPRGAPHLSRAFRRSGRHCLPESFLSQVREAVAG